jgi:GTP-binding protein
MADHEAHGGAGLRAVAGAGEPDAEAIEAARRLFAQPCRFVTGVARLDQLPAETLPEAAFCGRSNVGKSSLINALVGQTRLARTSNSPGRTRQINLFDLGRRLMLVDLPGYGFARAPKRAVAAWTALVDAYLRGRAGLRRVLVLIDARHGLKESDRRMMAVLDTAAVPYQVVLTKVSQGERAARIDGVRAALAAHVAAHPEVIATSARTGEGIAELRAALAALAAAEPVG